MQVHRPKLALETSGYVVTECQSNQGRLNLAPKLLRSAVETSFPSGLGDFRQSAASLPPGSGLQPRSSSGFPRSACAELQDLLYGFDRGAIETSCIRQQFLIGY